ncbi:hypothetical protein BVH74_16610 [Halopseudomonas phragmitis]|uniref:DUF4238 domain-containing protein n=2 Tax=Halopseudomonas phragmitis TaxID=1931241 RepID=A0A1V0B8L7_9GAMM|nr:hypothetical protein BVH74_16610 [Halopseudomonas phragmitis]
MVDLVGGCLEAAVAISVIIKNLWYVVIKPSIHFTVMCLRELLRMPEKKNQHLVPACYLKNFIADVSYEKKVNPNFTSGIYVNDKNLTAGWKLRSIRHKTLVKSYFYNLPEDDSKQPVIESYLSKVEGVYPKVFDEIRKGRTRNENMSFMSYFVTLQLMRVEAFVEIFQGAWDKIAEWMDAFEGKDNYQSALKDVAKRLLVSTDLGHVIHPHATIIYNSTKFPFVTSDNPVVRRQVNITDALRVIPKRYLLEMEDESTEVAFFFFPLSPNIAYLSCEMLKGQESLHFSDIDLENIFYLNYFSIVDSYSKVYSSVREPIKGGEQLSKILSSESGLIVKIYTQSKRIISVGSIKSDANSVVTLKVEDLEGIKQIKEGEQVKLMEVLEDGVSIRGMRECKASSVNYTNGEVVIESNIKLNT